jgi:hypothetical protein
MGTDSNLKERSFANALFPERDDCSSTGDRRPGRSLQSGPPCSRDPDHDHDGRDDDGYRSPAAAAHDIDDDHDHNP